MATFKDVSKSWVSAYSLCLKNAVFFPGEVVDWSLLGEKKTQQQKTTINCYAFISLSPRRSRWLF